jgi:outer membrane protein
MKLYKGTIFILAFMLTTMSFLGSVKASIEPDRLTLADSIALALNNNPTVKIAQSDMETAVWKVNQARAHNGISVDYHYNWARTDTSPSWYNNTSIQYPYSLNPLTGKWINYPAWTETYNAASQQLEVQYPLFTGGKIENSIKLAKHGEEAANLSIAATKQQLTAEVTTAYFNALQAKNLAAVAGQAVNDLEAHLKNVKNHYDAGTISLSDVLQTEVRLASARNNLIKGQNTFKLARYKLNKVIGLSLHNEAELIADSDFKADGSTVDEYLAMAFSKRPELSQAKLGIAMAHDHRQITESGDLPTVALFANDLWQDTLPSTSKHSNSWMVGVNVQLNVFDNGLTRTEIKQAEYEIKKAQEQLKQVEDKVTLEVCQAFLNVQEAIGRINNNEVAVHQSETDYQLTQERYENGVGTNLDVMDAELAMTQAKTNYVQALYDYHIGRAQLAKAIGNQ